MATLRRSLRLLLATSNRNLAPLCLFVRMDLEIQERMADRMRPGSDSQAEECQQQVQESVGGQKQRDPKYTFWPDYRRDPALDLCISEGPRPLPQAYLDCAVDKIEQAIPSDPSHQAL